MANNVVYSTDSYEHECNLNGITPTDVLSLAQEHLYLENPCVCGKDEIYSQTLTNGLCLNCYHQLQEELKMIEIECKHDYEAGLI